MRIVNDLIDTGLDLLRLFAWRRQSRDEGRDPYPWPGADPDYDAKIARLREEYRKR